MSGLALGLQELQLQLIIQDYIVWILIVVERLKSLSRVDGPIARARSCLVWLFLFTDHLRFLRLVMFVRSIGLHGIRSVGLGSRDALLSVCLVAAVREELPMVNIAVPLRVHCRDLPLLVAVIFRMLFYPSNPHHLLVHALPLKRRAMPGVLG